VTASSFWRAASAARARSSSGAACASISGDATTALAAPAGGGAVAVAPAGAAGAAPARPAKTMSMLREDGPWRVLTAAAAPSSSVSVFARLPLATA